MAIDTLSSANDSGKDDRLTWAEAFAAWQEADAAADDANSRFNEADDRYNSGAPALEPLMTDPALRHIPEEIRQWVIRTHDLSTAARQWRPALNAVEFERVLEKIEAWREADRAANEAAGRDKAAEACDRAYEAQSAALSKVLRTPAPTAAEALWKLDKLFGPQEFDQEGGSTPCWTAEWAVPVLDDVRRFLSAA